jgi:uncharacterized membrane protein YoaK (UPF0700 family)
VRRASWKDQAIVTDPTPLHGTPATRITTVEAFLRSLVDEQDGPLPALLLALTVLAGVVDATSILGLGNVFVATMTGNFVFLGLALAGAGGFAVATSAIAIGGFVVGSMVGGRAYRAGGAHRGRGLRNVLAVKLTLAAVITVTALAAGGHFSGGVRDLVVVLLAMSMGAQLAAIRSLKIADLPTVALTMTISGAFTDRGDGWHDPAVLRRLVAILAFTVGAVSGGLLVRLVSVTAALGLGLAIIVGVAVAAHRVSQSETGWSAPAAPPRPPTPDPALPRR